MYTVSVFNQWEFTYGKHVFRSKRIIYAINDIEFNTVERVLKMINALEYAATCQQIVTLFDEICVVFRYAYKKLLSLVILPDEIYYDDDYNFLELYENVHNIYKVLTYSFWEYVSSCHASHSVERLIEIKQDVISHVLYRYKQFHPSVSLDHPYTKRGMAIQLHLFQYCQLTQAEGLKYLLGLKH